jgi:hydroxypyruvate isomerase
VLHNLPAGDWDAGERGIACHPDRVAEFRAGVAKAIAYAKALGVPQLNCLAGKAPAGVPRRCCASPWSTTCASPRRAEGRGPEAADRADQHLRHPRLLPEPHRAGAGDPRRGRGADNAFVQYDIYHAQRMEGELAATLQRTWRASATSSWPTTPGATSRARARSTTPSCSRTWTASATPAGSAASTSRPPSTEAGLGWRQRLAV